MLALEARRSPVTMPERSAFDRSLELRELRRAAEAYAARRGEPGSASYRDAWLRFRRRIPSIEDLQRIRTASARTTSSA